MTVVPVPSLDALAADPARVQALPPDVARDLLLRLAPLHEALRLRAIELHAGVNGPPEALEGDRLLPIEEAAVKLGVSEDWLYRRAKTLPFTVRLGSRLRFSARGIERWARQRTG